MKTFFRRISASSAAVLAIFSGSISRAAAPENVVITAPTNGQTLNVTASGVTVSAVAEPSSPSATITRIEIRAGTFGSNTTTTVGNITGGAGSTTWFPTVAGNYSLTATAVDSTPAPNTRVSAPVIVNVASTPAGSGTGPALTSFTANGSTTIPVGSTRVFTAAVAANTSLERVEFLYDGSVVAIDGTAPYNFMFTAPDVPGPHFVAARAIDLNGVAGPMTTIAINISGVTGSAPSVAITTPSPNSFLAPGVASLISGTASDPDGAITTVQVYVNGTSLGNATLSGGSWSINWPAATPGAYSIVAIANDTNGNSVAAPAVAVTVGDASAPSLTLGLSPVVAGQTASLTLPSGATRNIVANAVASTGRAIVRVEFFVDGTKVGEDTTAPFTFRYVAPALPEGQISQSFVLSARATDNAGAARDVQIPVLVVSPIGEPPIVGLLTPTTGTVVVPGSDVSIAATATSPSGTITSVQFYVNGDPAPINAGTPTAGLPDTTAPYTVVFRPAAAGTYTIDAIATDDRFNTTVSTAAVITAAFATPTIAITSPNPNTTARATPNVPLNLTATATVGTGGAVQLVEFLLDGVQIGARTTPTNAALGTYTLAWTPTTAQLGAHVLTARVTDTNSQTSTSAPVNLNVATIVGTPPTVSITQPALGAGVGQASNLQSLSTVNFIANASSPVTGVTISNVEFFLNEVSIGTATREQASNLYRLTFDFSRFDFTTAPSVTDPNTGVVQYRPIPLYAIVRDSNNNQTVSNTINLTVNPSTSSPPSVQLQNVSGTTTISQGQQFLAGVISSDSDGTVAQIQLYANGLLVASANNPAQGQILTYTANTAGRFNLYAVAIDDTGNTSVATPAIVLNVTAVSAPVTTLTRPAADGTATSVGAPVFLEGTATNNDSTQIPTLQFVITAANGARTLITGQRVGTTNTYRQIWTPTAPGTYAISTQATVGTAQGTSTGSRSVIVTNLQGLAPTVTIAVPGTATTASQSNFTATATDSDGSVVEVEFFVNRNSIGFATRDDLANTWRITASFAGLPLGATEVQARARDSSGNVAASATSNINVVASTSIAPSISLETSTVNAAFNRQVQLRANARDTDGTVSSVQYFANGTPLGTSTNAGTRYQVNWTPNQSGTFNIWAVATDNSGITTVAPTVRITVRRNNPVVEDAAFILQTYQDLANTSNINPIVFDELDAQLGAGTISRADLVARLVTEPGFVSPVQVLAAYYVLMGQWPTPANYATVLANARNNNLAAAIGGPGQGQSTILGSNEYFAKYGIVPTQQLLNSPSSAIPADTFITRLWESAGLGQPSALANLQFRNNNILSATQGRGYNNVGLQQALAEFITNTNSTNTALYDKARAAAIFYQLDRPQVTMSVEQITARITELTRLGEEAARGVSVDRTAAFARAVGEAALRDPLYNQRYVTITRNPTSLVVNARSGALFSVEAQGAEPLTYQWLLNGAPIANATNSILSLTNVDATRVGTYTVIVSSPVTQSTSDPATLTLSPVLSRLANISTRGTTTGAGANLLIGGFVVTGNPGQTRQMLIRVVGPRLAGAPFNIAGVLADPRLEVFTANNPNPVLTNDNWGTQTGGAAQVTAIQQAANRVGAFALNNNSADAAILATLPPGLYTVQAKAPASNLAATGVVLIEVYDVTQGGPAGPRAANVSTRGLVGTGNNILIAGFVVNGTASRRMLIRGAGPTLANLGVPGVLADPQITLVDQATGQAIQTNDNWSSGPDAAIIASAASAAGAFPLANGSRDAAMLLMVAPGAYTVQLSGVNNGTGVGIVEVYDVDP